MDHGQRSILDTGTRQDRLATVAYRSAAEIEANDLEILWVRSNRVRSDRRNEPTLSLGYCATHTTENGWEAWCVDAGTGEASAFGSGVD